MLRNLLVGVLVVTAALSGCIGYGSSRSLPWWGTWGAASVAMMTLFWFLVIAGAVAVLLVTRQRGMEARAVGGLVVIGAAFAAWASVFGTFGLGFFAMLLLTTLGFAAILRDRPATRA